MAAFPLRNSHTVVCCVPVDLKYEGGHPAELEVVMGRKVINKLQEIYFSDLANMSFACDGERNLFTIGSLPNVRDVFTVVVEVEGPSYAKWAL